MIDLESDEVFSVKRAPFLFFLDLDTFCLDLGFNLQVKVPLVHCLVQVNKEEAKTRNKKN